MLGLALRVDERIARGEKVRRHQVPGERRIIEITGLGCDVERAAKQISGAPDRFCPQHKTPEVQVGLGLKPPQPSLLYQFIAELGEAKPGLIVAENRAGDRSDPFIREARPITVAAFETETDRRRSNQEMEIRV